MKDKPHLRSFMEAAPQAILMVSPSGEILYANPRTEEMFGYSRDEMVGNKLTMLLPDRHRAVHQDHQAGYFRDPKLRTMGNGMDLAGRRKNGTEFPVEVGLNCVETAEGPIALGLVTDITQRKKSEQELILLNERLRQSNQDLEQFTSVASHDLQEPLRMITNWLQLLERRHGGHLGQEGKEYLQFAVSGANRMTALIQDLLRLSRAGTQAVRFQRFPAQEVLEAALQNLGAAIEETGAIVTSDPLPELVGDEGLITQVFQNLVGNAIKFHNKGARPQVHVTSRREPGSWVLSIKDNGIGIESRHASRIFQAFERLHGQDQYTGSGIGLAVAKRIMERHGGSIWFESAMGSGSTFFISFPDRTVFEQQVAAA